MGLKQTAVKVREGKFCHAKTLNIVSIHLGTQAAWKQSVSEERRLSISAD